jgi:hypothetical protein
MLLLRWRSQAWHQLQPDYHHYFELSTNGPESSTAWFISKWALHWSSLLIDSCHSSFPELLPNEKQSKHAFQNSNMKRILERVKYTLQQHLNSSDLSIGPLVDIINLATLSLYLRLTCSYSTIQSRTTIEPLPPTSVFNHYLWTIIKNE